MNDIFLATSVNDYINLAIAVASLIGAIGAGLWKLRTLLRGDMETITRKHIGPLTIAQDKTNEEMLELRVGFNDHEKRLQKHEGEIQYIKGKQDARKEAAQAISGIGNVAQAISHQEDIHG